MITSVHEIIRKAEDNYLNGTKDIGEYVEWSMHDTIERIDAYLNSQHISGREDSLGREKPFFNIVTAATNIWYRATDLDRKDIRIIPDKTTNTASAFIATVLLQQWMKKEGFGMFLNQWGRALARYGSAVVKFVEKEGRLIPSVVPWNRLIVDPVDFDALPRIEKFYKTPAQLRQEGYDQDVVDELVSALQERETLDGQDKDTTGDFIELYEVHGELDTRLLEKDPDESIEDKDIKYRQQMHVVSYIQDGRDYKDFTLYRGKEKRDPYMLTHLIEEDGRTLGIGAVEYLFDAQWMANHTVKNMKDTLDLASKLIFQTADSKFVGRNVLSAIETGDVLIHNLNMPLTRMANDKPDIQALMNFGTMWQNLGQELTSTPESIRGTTLPSGTPYSLGAYLGGQAGSLFEIMTENKGLYTEAMMRQFVLPHLKTKMDTKDEVVAILDDQCITEIDAMYVPKEAIKRYNERTLDTMLQGSVPSPYVPEVEEGNVRKGLAQMGNKRGFVPDEMNEKTWKEALKDLEWEVNVEVTNESTDKAAVLQTLSSVLQTIASNPMILQDPNAKMVFSTILTETGRISPLQLQSVGGQSPPVGGGMTPDITSLLTSNAPQQ